jgi:hypothetical protein
MRKLLILLGFIAASLAVVAVPREQKADPIPIETLIPVPDFVIDAVTPSVMESVIIYENQHISRDVDGVESIPALPSLLREKRWRGHDINFKDNHSTDHFRTSPNYRNPVLPSHLKDKHRQYRW